MCVSHASRELYADFWQLFSIAVECRLVFLGLLVECAQSVQIKIFKYVPCGNFNSTFYTRVLVHFPLMKVYVMVEMPKIFY